MNLPAPVSGADLPRGSGQRGRSVPGVPASHPGQYAFLMASGVLAALGQLALLGASRRAPASAVGQAQYSQLVWAVLIGLAFHDQVPDVLAVVGMVVIAGAGLVAALAAQRAAVPATAAPD